MAVVLSQDVQPITAPVTVVTTAETLVVVGFALPLTSDHAKAVVRGWIELPVPTGTNSITLTIYAGTTPAGRKISSITHDASGLVGVQPSHWSFEVVDVLQSAGVAQYCMSVTQVGATANGTVAQGLLDTTLLSG